MKKKEPATVFVRIETPVRDRLRAHCQREGYVMGALATRVLAEFLDQQPHGKKARARRRPRKKPAGGETAAE